MVSPHGGLVLVTLPYHDLRPFFYLTSSHLAESKLYTNLTAHMLCIYINRLLATPNFL